MNIDALLSPSDETPSRDATISASPSAVTSSPQKGRPHLAARTSARMREELPASSPRSITAATSQSTPPVTSPGCDSRVPASRSPQFAPPSYYAATAAGPASNLYGPPTTLTSAPGPVASGSGSRQAQSNISNVNRRPVVTRPTSTPSMETLADLATNRQREASHRIYSADSIPTVNSIRSRASSSARPPPVARHPSVMRLTSTQPSVDFIMAEASSSTPEPPANTSTALSQDQAKEVHDLLSYLAENSYAYESHVRLLNLLHQGFVCHVRPPIDSPDPVPKEPSSYSLLSELRQARNAMDTRFAVGEDLWADWLADEMLLAASSEDRIRVTELCQKAVQDQPTSVKLWQMYADWISANYASCHDLDGADRSRWTAEDKETCRELFTRDMLLDVYEQAASAVQWRIDESHVLWDRYAALLLEDVPFHPSRKDVERLLEVYMQRLKIPHYSWTNTKQMFWQVVSKYESNNWEYFMHEADKLAGEVQKQTSLRETHEHNLTRFRQAGDRDAEVAEFTQYLQWEKKQAGKSNTQFTYQLRSALFERALLRFPTAHEWWLDYVDFIIGSNPTQSVLPLLERATRHCPWSGDLWGRRILRSDVEGKAREEIEATKHRATNSGLLDIGGMEELLKVLQQWCSYLRRYAFRRAGAEDDRDVAELGITAALDDIVQAGLKLYGKDFKGDPSHRLEKIHLKFLIEARRIDDARAIWRTLVPLQKDSYDFWNNYYSWELWLWGYDRITEPKRVETAANGPHLASAVLQEALSQRNLDWPEKALDMYLNHFQQHESGEKLQSALIDAREFSKHLAVRRAKEAEDSGLAAAQQAQATASADVDLMDDSAMPVSEKRKREADDLTNGHGAKKPRTDNAPHAAEISDPSAAVAPAQVKRDREHNVVTVKDLPNDTTELDIKKFFRDVGAPLSITILADKSSETATAMVEFESHADVLAAKTRNGKPVKGYEVRIQSGTQSTLYVANYPAEHDEEAMRKLFEDYGEIVSVRFPSLKFNNRRRFCYVQFLTTEMAKAAEAAMNDKVLDGQHRLLAKISDPDAKKQRSGAQAEGRELFVKNLERSAPDREIQAFFEQYGTVVSINTVKLVSGKRTGTAFIVFSSPEEATAALAANNKPLFDRILHVELASSRARVAPLDRARKEDITIKQSTASPEPDANANGHRRASDASMASSSAAAANDSWKTARERKIAIFQLPDTVNDARIRTAMETHGPLVKIQMRRADHGAIVEFANVHDAFNVRQGVDCSALGPDVSTGDVADLLAGARRRQGGEPAGGGGDAGSARGPSAVSQQTLLFPPQARRGGLGSRRGGTLGLGTSRAGAQQTGGRSNSDFRAMFEKSRENT